MVSVEEGLERGFTLTEATTAALFGLGAREGHMVPEKTKTV